MNKVEYLVVGSGFAALFAVHQLVKRHKTFRLVGVSSNSASRISAGIVNPVILKKFSTFPDALSQILHLRRTLNEMSQYLKKDFWIDEKVHRIFHDDAERLLWYKKAKDEKLSEFLSLMPVRLPHISNDFGCGIVEHSGRVDVEIFFETFFSFLREHEFFIEKQFNHSNFDAENMTYENLEASKVIFAEGMEVKNNRYFNDIPVIPNKGHQLTLKAPEMILNETVKKRHFLFKRNADSYYYGGTYDRTDFWDEINLKSEEELLGGLNGLIPNYAVSEHETNYAFRPTVKDRKPILGKHLHFPQLFLFNGLGTRGLLNASFYAPQLINFAEGLAEIEPSVDLQRFYNL